MMQLYLANGQFINLDDGIYDGVGLNEQQVVLPQALRFQGDENETVDVGK
jgi:hypothetical protein